MDSSDKNKLKRKSKIPIPVSSAKKNDSDITRQPLKTLLDQASNIQIIKPKENEIDSIRGKLKRCHSLKKNIGQFVTIRSNIETSDLNYSVFRDGSQIDPINQDNNNNGICPFNQKVATEAFFSSPQKAAQYFSRKFESERITTSSTPLEACTVEHKSLKNVKKSLKRPHSRELQGLSIPSKDERENLAEIHKPCVQFNNVTNHDSMYASKISYDTIHWREYGLDMLDYLLMSEEKWPRPEYLSSVKNRACSLNWLINLNGKGDPAVIHTAMWYLDSVYKKRVIREEDIPVAVCACFWISRKIHGPIKAGKSIVKCSGNIFNVASLCRAERKILMLLKLPRQPILAQDFIRYLAWKFDGEHSEEICVAASFICLNAMVLNMDMCDQYPSAIAAAAVRTALLLLGKTNLVEKLRGCYLFQTALQKMDLIEVCINQIEALKILQTADFDFTAPTNLCRNHKYVLEKINSELNYLYNTGGEGIIRAFLM